MDRSKDDSPQKERSTLCLQDSKKILSTPMEARAEHRQENRLTAVTAECNTAD